MNTKKRVLLVDNDEDWLALLSRLLEAEGFAVLKAQSGAEALRVMETESPACVVADLRLRDESGLDVCRRLREKPGFGELPVVIVSGAEPEAAPSGRDTFVCKADGTGAIVRAIRKVLG